MESYLGCLGIPPIHHDCSVCLRLELFEDAVHFWFEVLQFGVDLVLGWKKGESVSWSRPINRQKPKYLIGG